MENVIVGNGFRPCCRTVKYFGPGLQKWSLGYTALAAGTSKVKPKATTCSKILRKCVPKGVEKNWSANIRQIVPMSFPNTIYHTLEVFCSSQTLQSNFFEECYPKTLHRAQLTK